MNNKKNESSNLNKDEKNEGYNSWTSVPRTYDAKESCKKHEKSATDNQWCSCNK